MIGYHQRCEWMVVPGGHGYLNPYNKPGFDREAKRRRENAPSPGMRLQTNHLAWPCKVDGEVAIGLSR